MAEENISKATQEAEMLETMNEIERQDKPAVDLNFKESLKKEILNLEIDIKAAEEIIQQSQSDRPMHNPVSPEQANEMQKDLVFLRKALDKKRIKYDESE